MYGQSSKGAYYESEQLSIYLSGKQQQDGWRTKGILSDFFVAKGAATAIFNLLGLQGGEWKQTSANQIDYVVNKKTTGTVQVIGAKKLQAFGIKQPVWLICLRFIKASRWCTRKYLNILLWKGIWHW